MQSKPAEMSEGSLNLHTVDNNFSSARSKTLQLNCYNYKPLPQNSVKLTSLNLMVVALLS